MSYLQKRLDWKRFFDKEAQLPKTKEECQSWFIQLVSELSPENLSCDGELSRGQVQAKLRTIKAEWKELEEIYGEPVSEDQAENWMFKSIRS